MDPTFENGMAFVHPEDRDRVQLALQQALAGKGEFESEYRTTFPDGSVHWIGARGRAIFDDAGRPERMIGVAMDITSNKLAEDALRKSEKLAAAGRLAATIAHEINNPLEALTNLIYLSTHTDDQKQVQEFLKQATKELDRVAKITKQILSFHRETKIAVQLDFQDMVQSVLALYVVQLKAKQITVDYKKGPAFSIYGFPGELRQVFANLIGNAIDASPEHGSLCIRIRKGSLQGIPGVVFTIHDEGPGIPKELRNRVLEPFFTTKELKGSGLGLWLANSLVMKHRGSLRFRSRRASGGAGTCFRVFLPIGMPVEFKSKAGKEKPVPELIKKR
jgi:signal transduction histidine kinase